MEALRTVKETAEQPEKEAKERHLKAWEGTSTYSAVSPAIYCLLRELHYSLKRKCFSVTEKKAVIRAEKDKAKMVQVFLELDTDADGL